MNNAYLERAKKKITDSKLLAIVAAKRARQLAFGARPMVKCPDENHLDIALLEIAEGKVVETFIDPKEQMAASELEKVLDTPAE